MACDRVFCCWQECPCVTCTHSGGGHWVVQQAATTPPPETHVDHVEEDEVHDEQKEALGAAAEEDFPQLEHEEQVEENAQETKPQLTAEALRGLNYREVQKLARSLGISGKGKKVDMCDQIMKLQ